MTNNNPPFGTYDQLLTLFLQLTTLQAALPFCALDLQERKEWGGYFIPDGPGLVYVVAGALARQPWLFPDVPVNGAALLHKQRCALVWLAMRNGLRIMTQLASDTYLLVQGEATKEALSVVRHVHDGGHFRLSGKDITGDRHAPLVAAYFIVDAYYRSLYKKKKGKKKQKQEQAGTVPKKAARRSSAQVRDKFHADFLKLLQAGPPPSSTPSTDAGPATPPDAADVMHAVQILATLPAQAREQVCRLLK